MTPLRRVVIAILRIERADLLRKRQKWLLTSASLMRPHHDIALA